MTSLARQSSDHDHLSLQKVLPWLFIKAGYRIFAAMTLSSHDTLKCGLMIKSVRANDFVLKGSSKTALI